MLRWIAPATLPALMQEFCRELDAVEAASAGPCPVALTGGESAAAFYDAWAAHGVAPSFAFYWSDERMVGLEDPDSNYRLAHARLLQPGDVSPALQHPMPTSLPAPECARAYAAKIRQQVPAGPDGVPRFPLIILGLGADGHTASLFPGRDPHADDALLVRAVEGTAAHPHARATFTPGLINAAQRVWIVVTGAQKAWAVTQLARRDAAVDQVPALAVDPAKTQVTIFADFASSASIRTRHSEMSI